MKQQAVTLTSIAFIAALTAATPHVALAQNCEAMPDGPGRTDCYIGRARIGGAKATVAKDAARVGADVEHLRAVTGVEPKVGRKKPKRKPKPKT